MNGFLAVIQGRHYVGLTVGSRIIKDELQGDGSTEMHLVEIVLTGRHKDQVKI